MTQQSGWSSPYGPEDQIGMLNEITPLKRTEVARLVQRGQVYDLGHVLDEKVPAQQFPVEKKPPLNPPQKGEVDRFSPWWGELEGGNQLIPGITGPRLSRSQLSPAPDPQRPSAQSPPARCRTAGDGLGREQCQLDCRGCLQYLATGNASGRAQPPANRRPLLQRPYLERRNVHVHSK